MLFRSFVKWSSADKLWAALRSGVLEAGLLGTARARARGCSRLGLPSGPGASSEGLRTGSPRLCPPGRALPGAPLRPDSGRIRLRSRPERRDVEASGGDAGHRATAEARLAGQRRGPGSGRVHWPDPVALGHRRTRTARWPFVRPEPEVRRRRAAQWVVLRCGEVPPCPRRSPALSGAGPPGAGVGGGSPPPRERALGTASPARPRWAGRGQRSQEPRGRAGAAGWPPAPASPVRCGEPP